MYIIFIIGIRKNRTNLFCAHSLSSCNILNDAVSGTINNITFYHSGLFRGGMLWILSPVRWKSLLVVGRDQVLIEVFVRFNFYGICRFLFFMIWRTLYVKFLSLPTLGASALCAGLSFVSFPAKDSENIAHRGGGGTGRLDYRYKYLKTIIFVWISLVTRTILNVHITP